MGTRIKIDTAALGIQWQKNTTYTVKVDQGFGVGPSNLAERESVELENALTFTTNATGPTANVDIGTSVSNQLSYPYDNGVIAGDEIRIYFNRVIQKGTGTIRIYNSVGDVLIKSFNIENEGTISGHTLTLNVTALFTDLEDCYILMDEGVVRDIDGFTSEAITSKTAYTFSTALNYIFRYYNPSGGDITLYDEDTTTSPTNWPTIIDEKYTDSGGYIVTISPRVAGSRSYYSPANDPFPNAIATMSVNYPAAQPVFDPTTKVLTLTGTRSAINAALSTLTVTPSGNFQESFNLRYELTTPRSVERHWEFLFAFDAADTNITNMPTTLEFNNAMSDKLFPGTPPTITDLDPTGTQFTISLVSSAGALMSINYGNPGSTFTYTGTRSECNNVLSNLLYHSIPGSITDTVTYTQTKATDVYESYPTIVVISMNAKTIGSGDVVATLTSASVDNGVVTYGITDRSTPPYNVGDTITVTGFPGYLNLFAGGTITEITNTYIKMNDTVGYYNSSNGTPSQSPSGSAALFGNPRLITFNVDRLYSLDKNYRITVGAKTTGSTGYGNFITKPYAVTPTSVTFYVIDALLGQADQFQGATVTYIAQGYNKAYITLPGFDHTVGNTNNTIIEFSTPPGFQRYSYDTLQTSIANETKFYVSGGSYINGIFYKELSTMDGHPVDMSNRNGSSYDGYFGYFGTIEEVYFPDGRATQTSSTGGEGVFGSFNTLGQTSSLQYNVIGTLLPGTTLMFPFSYPTGPDAYTIPSTPGQWADGWPTGRTYKTTFTSSGNSVVREGYCLGTYRSNTGNFAILNYSTNPGTWVSSSPIYPTFTLDDTTGLATGTGTVFAPTTQVEPRVWSLGSTRGSQSVSLTYDELRYGKFLAFVVGGGGASGANKIIDASLIPNDGSQPPAGAVSIGGGGGGGEVIWATFTPSSRTIPVFIGASGANPAPNSNLNGPNGQDTSVNGIVARGGHGGTAATSSAGGTGGASGNGNAGGASYGLYGGGGAGAYSYGMALTTAPTNEAGGVGGLGYGTGDFFTNHDGVFEVIVRQHDGDESIKYNAGGGWGRQPNWQYFNTSTPQHAGYLDLVGQGGGLYNGGVRIIQIPYHWTFIVN